MRFWCYAKGEEFNFDGVWGIFENTQQNESSSSSSSLLLELISQITTSYMYAQHEKRERENWISFLTSHPATLRHPIEHSSKKHKVDEQQQVCEACCCCYYCCRWQLCELQKKSKKKTLNTGKKSRAKSSSRRWWNERQIAGEEKFCRWVAWHMAHRMYCHVNVRLFRASIEKARKKVCVRE